MSFHINIEKYFHLSDSDLIELAHKFINSQDTDEGVAIFEKLKEKKYNSLIIHFLLSLIKIHANKFNATSKNFYRDQLLTLFSEYINKFNYDNPYHLEIMGRLSLELAEICYRLGPRDLSRILYEDMYDSLWPLKHHYYYAEILAEQSFPQSLIHAVMLRAVSSDHGKQHIRNELIQRIQDNLLSVDLIKEISEAGYRFSNSWFSGFKENWEKIILPLNPRKILEIGTYEGQSICYLIDKLANTTDELEVHVIDAWNSAAELESHDFDLAEQNFDFNIATSLKDWNNIKFFKHKEYSYLGLSKLIAAGKKNYFDLIYIDGSHLAKDVLSDASMAFHLLKVGGLIGFDDYLFDYRNDEIRDILDNPKFAIDSFVNINIRSLNIIIEGVNSQFWLKKVSD